MTSRNLVLVFGDTEIAEGVIAATISPAGPGGVGVDFAEVVITTETLIAVTIDYRSEVRLLEVAGEERKPQFTGIVDTVTPNGDTTKIKLVTVLQLLAETGSGGLGIETGTDRIEIVWSLLRAWGIESQKIQLEDFGPGLPGMHEVAVAVDGINTASTIDLGSVQLLPKGVVSRLADGLGPEELWLEYAEASTWALALPTASTLFDAESIGLKAIDVALAWLTALVQYSASRSPTGKARPYHREWTQVRISRRSAVVVKRSATGGRWLRTATDISAQVPLRDDHINDLSANTAVPAMLSVTMREALLAWWRAEQAADSLGAVVALWEAIEFYASGVKVDKMFKGSELEAIRTAATNSLEGDKAKRVSDILGRLNEAPLMTRVSRALEEDHVPHTENELAILKRVRKARNDLVHGRSRLPPSESDLRYAIAIVNRMLVYRMSRLSDQASASPQLTVAL